MLDQRAREHLYGLLSSSLADCVTSLSGIRPVTGEQWNALQQQREARLVVLTLSGYCFRGLVCLLADSRTATCEMSGDALQELANNLCGTLKRRLSDSLHELGMSTPNALPVGCIAYLQQSDQQLMAVSCVDAQGTVLHACLLVLDADDGWAPPPEQQSGPASEALGELELF